MSTYRRSAIGPVQAAIFQWLSADAALIAIAPVYDFVPEGTPMPYVEITEVISTPSNTEGTQGRDVLVTLFAFSKSPGFLELEEILDNLMRLLDEDVIADASPYPGWHINWNQVTREEVIRIPGAEGMTRQLAMQVQVIATRDVPGE